MFGKKKDASKKDTPKKTPKKKMPKISYKLRPTNYAILSEQEKMDVLRNFIRIFRGSSEKPVRMTIMNKSSIVSIPGDTEPRNYTERAVYITSKYDMGPEIMGSGFPSTRLDEPLDFTIEKENLNSMKMKPSGCFRAYVVYDFSHSIRPAWLSKLADLCSIVNVDVKFIRPDKAGKMLLVHANTVGSRIGKRYQEEAETARALNDMLTDNDTVIYECTISAIVTSEDEKSLKKACAEFERQARRQQIKVMSVQGKQAEILSGWGHPFIFPEQSTAAFYPFMSGDLMEASESGGVYLGVNELTGVPVVYDYLNRTNYNMTILGSSGFGKSMTAKTYIDNFFSMIYSKYGKDHRIMAYIFDLHGEYAKLADHMGMETVDLLSTNQMGLDPFVLFESKNAAVDIITDVVDMPANLKSLTVSKAQNVGTTRELVEKLRADTSADSGDCRAAATYLAQFAEGDLAKVFSGDVKLGDKTVIAMRGASETKINAMLISLALQKAWQDMRAAPTHVPKFLVLEEAWFTLRMPSTAKIISNIARSGRKENVHMIVMTQDINEVLSNEHGAAVIQNSATVILMRLQHDSAELLQKVINISANECDDITTMDKGQAIIRADSNRIKMKVRPTPEQMKLFDTSAGAE